MIFPTSRTQKPARIVPGRTILYAGCLLACLVGREKVLCPAGESCHLTHALEILASLPRDEGALAGSASYVLYNVDLYLQEGSTQSTKGFCKFVLDIFSLSFERLGFQLPSLHSLHAVTKPAEQLLCFEQLLITASSRVPSRTRRAEWSNATRDDAESDELWRLTYKYCGIRPRCGASGPEQRRTLLFFLNVVTIGWSRMPHNCACKCGLAGRPGCSKSPKISIYATRRRLFIGPMLS